MRICKIKFYKYIYQKIKNIFFSCGSKYYVWGVSCAEMYKKKIAEIFILAFKKEIKIQYVTNKKKNIFIWVKVFLIL